LDWKSLALPPLIPCLGWLEPNERLRLHLPASIGRSHWLGLHLLPLIACLGWLDPLLPMSIHHRERLGLHLLLIHCACVASHI
jgi:hypothetical protein